MHRASNSKWLVPVLAPLGLLFAVEAQAAPPPPSGGLDGGGYIQVSPGVVGVGIGQSDFRDDYRLSWAGAVGAGWMLSVGPFKATFGGAFEHHMLYFQKEGIQGMRNQSMHFMGEMRIGAGSRRVWGYGLLGVGPALTLIDWNDPNYAGTRAYRGLDFEFGGGVQGMITRRFFLGGEVDFDHGFYFRDDHVDGDRIHHHDGDFAYHTMTLKFLLGWYF